MRTLLFPAFAFACYILLHSAYASPDVTDVVQKVARDLDTLQLNGVSPKRKRRATPVSREISRRNEIFRKSVKEVVGLGYNKDEAIEAVRRVVRSTRRGPKGRGRRPPGFGGHRGHHGHHGLGIHERPTYTDEVETMDSQGTTPGASCVASPPYRACPGGQKRSPAGNGRSSEASTRLPTRLIYSREDSQKLLLLTV